MIIDDQNKITIALLFAALEKALLEIPSGRIVFECDPRESVFLGKLQNGEIPVKIKKAVIDGLPREHVYEARVLKGYRIVERSGQQGIQCCRCERVSFHPGDIKQKFCAYCNIFHTDEEYKEQVTARVTGKRLIDLD